MDKTVEIKRKTGYLAKVNFCIHIFSIFLFCPQLNFNSFFVANNKCLKTL